MWWGSSSPRENSTEERQNTLSQGLSDFSFSQALPRSVLQTKIHSHKRHPFFQSLYKMENSAWVLKASLTQVFLETWFIGKFMITSRQPERPLATAILCLLKAWRAVVRWRWEKKLKCRTKHKGGAFYSGLMTLFRSSTHYKRGKFRIPFISSQKLINSSHCLKISPKLKQKWTLSYIEYHNATVSFGLAKVVWVCLILSGYNFSFFSSNVRF